MGCEENKLSLQKKQTMVLKRCNREAFKNIQTEKEAYWLGFLLADGCNIDDKCIRIDIKDSDHLEELSKVIYPFDKPSIHKRDLGFGTIYYFSCSVLDIVKNLSNYGVVPRKSKVAVFPSLKPSLIRHLIRGIFDGDGSLSYVLDGNYRRYNFNISGSESITKTLQEQIYIHTNITVGYGKMKSIFRIHKKGNIQILELLNWLYKDSTIYLDRKYQKYQDMLNYYKLKTNK